MLARRFVSSLWRVTALAALSAGLTACPDKTSGTDVKPETSGKPQNGGDAPAIKEWKVGAYLSLSGDDTAFGVDTKEGIDLAIESINAKGGPIATGTRWCA